VLPHCRRTELAWHKNRQHKKINLCRLVCFLAGPCKILRKTEKNRNGSNKKIQKQTAEKKPAEKPRKVFCGHSKASF